jgi:hypothetical protein
MGARTPGAAAAPGAGSGAVVRPWASRRFGWLPAGLSGSGNETKQLRRRLLDIRTGNFPLSDKGGKWMCEKCVELDEKIEHYRRLSSGITDQATLEGIKKLIGQMQAQKAALHPERSQ